MNDENVLGLFDMAIQFVYNGMEKPSLLHLESCNEARLHLPSVACPCKPLLTMTEGAEAA